MYGDFGDWDKAVEVLERIKSDNDGTQVAEMAEMALQRVNAFREQLAQMEAQKKAAEEAAGEASDDDAQPDSSEQPEETEEEPVSE